MTLAEGFPRGKSKLRGRHTENFQEGSRETQKSRKRSSEMAVNVVRDQDRLDGASNFEVWKARILSVLNRNRLKHFALNTIAILVNPTKNGKYKEAMVRVKSIILDRVKDHVVPHIAEKDTQMRCGRP